MEISLRVAPCSALLCPGKAFSGPSPAVLSLSLSRRVARWLCTTPWLPSPTVIASGPRPSRPPAQRRAPRPRPARSRAVNPRRPRISAGAHSPPPQEPPGAAAAKPSRAKPSRNAPRRAPPTSCPRVRRRPARLGPRPALRGAARGPRSQSRSRRRVSSAPRRGPIPAPASASAARHSQVTVADKPGERSAQAPLRPLPATRTRPASGGPELLAYRRRGAARQHQPPPPEEQEKEGGWGARHPPPGTLRRLR